LAPNFGYIPLTGFINAIDILFLMGKDKENWRASPPDIDGFWLKGFYVKLHFKQFAVLFAGFSDVFVFLVMKPVYSHMNPLCLEFGKPFQKFIQAVSGA